MDTDALKAFIAIAELGSFSRAAETLYLTQPAVSKRIASLEDKLDHTLFDRAGRSITLTEAGRALLPRAKAILAATDEAVQAINDLSGQVKGELKLTTSHHLGLHYLPKYLRHYGDRYPEVKLALNFKDSEIALQQVLDGEVELAALTLATQADERLVEAMVWDDPMAFVAAADHPLSSMASPGIKDLAQYPAIVPEANTFTTQLLSDAFTAAGLTLETRMATNYLETIKTLVSIGLGWGVLPITMVDGGFTTLPVLDKPLVRRLGIIHHRDRSLSNASQAFLDLLLASRRAN
ncbi:LysR family transcriptional regulator [Halioxenophilus aromaticivorans]|uniref:LysR family transcriptional regulator n=1 Tax=Halioxenophilus aromaticivorans TaxID=1306992 RepID=A0AAV3TVW1_9ALTE